MNRISALAFFVLLALGAASCYLDPTVLQQAGCGGAPAVTPVSCGPGTHQEQRTDGGASCVPN